MSVYITKEKYIEIIQKDMKIVAQYIPEGIDKDHILLVLSTSIDYLYDKKTEKKNL